MYKVSIVVPVYNVASYIKKCIDSLVEQSFTDFEVVFVNDKTPDNSVELIHKYSRGKINYRVIEHNENQGLAAARNTGLKESNTPYIYFLDSDDFICSNTLSDMYSVIQKFDSDFVVGNVVYWYEDTKEETEDFFAPMQMKSFYGKKLEEVPFIAGHVTAWHKLIKREFLLSNQIEFNPALRKHEDNPFSAQLYYYSNNFSFTKKSTLYYRQRGALGTSSIMAIADEDYNAKYKWLCFKEIVENLFGNQHINLNKLRVMIILNDSMDILEEVIAWKFDNLNREFFEEIKSEIRNYFELLPTFKRKLLIQNMTDHLVSVGLQFEILKSDWIEESAYRTQQLSSSREKYSLALKIKDYFILKRSKTFDASYYLRTNEDIRKKDVSPTWHFITEGAWQGKKPSSLSSYGNYFKTIDCEEIGAFTGNPYMKFIKESKNAG